MSNEKLFEILEQQAKQEYDEKITTISERLKFNYQKYLEIKDMQPDMELYQFLLQISKSTFKILTKNGFKLDEN